ncbi:hypothetical protein ACSU64_27850 [Bacillaceae bacterium C204]|uniref:hypothetical protein n=1 Tax=Neobacillus sp. 204 TaxID=3383351 RepID=UPI003979D49F
MKPVLDILFPVTVTANQDGNEKEYYLIQDRHGYICKSDEVLDILEKAVAFYKREDINDWIERENQKTSIELYSSYNFDVDFKKNKAGKFMIPSPQMNYKEFNSKKAHWGFKCGWCESKVSSKTSKGYYTLSFPHIQNLEHGEFVRACSKECGALIWKDTFKHWIHDNDYQDLFE